MLIADTEQSAPQLLELCETPLLLPPQYAEQLAVNTQKRSMDYEGHYGYNDFRSTSDGIAVLRVEGVLMSRGYSWRSTNYAALRHQLREAEKDESVRGILLDINSPGGMVDNVDDTAQLIREVSKTKPVWAMAYNQMTSGAYWLASACNRIIATSSARIGSIGVLVMHADYSTSYEKSGVNVSLIHAGERKTEGNHYQPLPEDVRQRIQTVVDETYDLFTQRVAEYRGTTQQAIKNTEAGIFTAAQAITHNLVDEVLAADDVLTKFSQSLLLSAGGTLVNANSQGDATMSVEAPAGQQKPAPAQQAPVTVETPAPTAPTAPQQAEATELLALCESQSLEFMASDFIKAGVTKGQAEVQLAEAGKIRDVLVAGGLEDQVQAVIKECGTLTPGMHKAIATTITETKAAADPEQNAHPDGEAGQPAGSISASSIYKSRQQ